jgi:tetratricopeptide (TPR) repeat protein
MNRRLSTWLLFGALLVWPLTAGGQETDSRIARRMIFNAPSFQAEAPTETSRANSPSVSVRELSIPRRASNAYKKGIDHLAKHDPAGSLVHLQHAASEFPDFYEAYYAIGLAQLNLGRQEEAQQAFQRSIDASGGHYAKPLFGLSLVLCNQQKFAEAEPIIRRALELAPSFVPGQFTLAWTLFGLNRLDEAEKNAHEVLVRDPRLALAHLLLAHIYNRRGDASTVLSEVDAYLRLTPDGPLSDQMRVVQESLRRKVAMPVVIAGAGRATH